MPRPSQPERDAIIYNLHNKGKSFGQLAAMFKLDKKTVWEAYWKVATREGKQAPKSFVGLSTV